MRDPDWLSDEAWAILEPHLPKNRPGAPRVDDRRDGIVEGEMMGVGQALQFGS